MATILRFIVTGLFNTAVGYAIILVALAQGAGDYGANVLGYVIGFPVSYFTQRAFTFRDARPPSFAQAGSFAIAMAVAFCANLAVLFAARQAGYVENRLAQLVAIGTYAAVFFLLSRLVVFRRSGRDIPI